MRRLLPSLAFIAAACGGERQVAGPLRSAPGAPAVVVFDPPLEVRGPRRDLCVAAAQPDSVPFGGDYAFHTRGGRVVHLQVAFVQARGRRVLRDPAGARHGVGDRVCFEPESAGGAIRAVELRSDGPLDVAGIYWFTGRPSALGAL